LLTHSSMSFHVNTTNPLTTIPSPTPVCLLFMPVQQCKI
jgi:hypothetical protein